MPPHLDIESFTPSEINGIVHLIRHPVHYYHDGTFIFIAENYIFRIYKGILAKRSEVFRDLFSIPQVDHDSSTIPDNKGDAKNTTASKDASQDDQIVIDGVPAVRLDDNAKDFAALLDIIIPDRIPLTKPQYTFDELSGVYKLCEKYLIDDIRNWALLWLEDILPTSEMDISKLGEVYTSPSVVARVIEFAQDANLLQFLPFAYYAMATYSWSSADGANSFFEAGACLSAHDGYRVEVGRAAIQAEILSGMFNALPDIGLPGRAPCLAGTVTGGICAKARRHAWSDPSKLIADVLKSPLEFFDRRVKIPPKKWCASCTVEAVRQAALLRHALYQKLPSVFLLS